MAGHRLGRWSCRLDYPRGFDCGEQAGIKAERDRWEAAGTTLGEITAWAGARLPEPEEWPEPDATALLGPPSKDALFAAAARRGFPRGQARAPAAAPRPGPPRPAACRPPRE